MAATIDALSAIIVGLCRDSCALWLLCGPLVIHVDSRDAQRSHFRRFLKFWPAGRPAKLPFVLRLVTRTRFSKTSLIALFNSL